VTPLNDVIKSGVYLSDGVVSNGSLTSEHELLGSPAYAQYSAENEYHGDAELGQANGDKDAIKVHVCPPCG